MPSIPLSSDFIESNINPRDLIEISAKPGLDERIVSNVPLGDNVKINIGESLLKRSGWQVVLHGRSVSNLIDNISINIGDFVGRIGINCPDGCARIDIGSCGYISMNCYMGKNSSLVIGDRTTCNGADLMNIESFIHIGRDCMLSKEILVQASPQHAIISAYNREVLNLDKRSVVIADHVWIGRRAVVLPKVSIDRGSIVGASAVVARDVPAFVAVAGNPARVVKEGVTWSRNLSTLDTHTASFLDEVAFHDSGSTQLR